VSRLITYLSRHATVLLAVGVLTGLVLPDMARVMRPALGPAIWGLLFVALLWVDVASVLNHVRRPVVLAAAVVWMLIVAPVLAWLVMLAVDLAPGIETAVVMMAGSSPITSAPALAMRPWGRDSARTIAYINANRNLAVFLAVLPADIDPDVALFFALGQIPMLVMPAILAPFYRRMLMPK